jgi:phage/plasmid primase-like uncharacterized protein
MARGLITDEVVGRWRELLPRLGVDKKFLTGRNGPCPACGGRDRFRFHDRTKNGDYYCNQCGAGKGLGLVMKVNGWDARTAVKAIRELIGGAPYPVSQMDKAHRAARAFFDAQPDRQEIRDKARLNILLDENISFEAAMKLLEMLPPKVA